MSKDKEQDGVLLKDFEKELVQASLVDGFAQYITPDTIERIAKYFLAKAREAVKGAGFGEGQILEALFAVIDIPDGDLPTAYQVIAEAQTQAILKALGGE